MRTSKLLGCEDGNTESRSGAGSRATYLFSVSGRQNVGEGRVHREPGESGRDSG